MTPEERDEVFAQGKEAGRKEARESMAAGLDLYAEDYRDANIRRAIHRMAEKIRKGEI